MVRSGGVLRPPEDPSGLLAIAPELEQIAELAFVPLMNKDSVNVTPDDWTAIAEAIHARPGYDGFVVTHGTDTMQYTASALAFAFGPELGVPVVLTGSQIDASSLHGDARSNLVRAVLVATGPIAEVVVVFGDRVFRGVRSQKRDRQRLAAFESPGIAPLAEIGAEIVVHPSAHRRPGTGAIPAPAGDFSSEVVQVTLVPGLRPRSLLPLLDSAATRGLILQTFGAGNVPDEGPFSYMPLIEAAVAAEIPVVLTSQFPASSTIGSPYATGARAVRAGAIPTANMTHSAAYVKFRWVLSGVAAEIQGGQLGASERHAEVARRMATAYVGELDPEPRPSRGLV